MDLQTFIRPRSTPATLAFIALPFILLLLLLGGRDGFLGLTHHVGYAVCHQIPVRTYVFGDLVMPLCARCSGQYLGVLVGVFLTWRWGRLRVAELPPWPLLLALLVFLGLWAFDGANSYMALMLNRPFLYPPHNVLRLSTGLLQGLALWFLFLPFVNQVVWVDPQPQPVLAHGRELILGLALLGILGVAVHSRWLPLFYSLAFLSVLGVMLLLTMAGALLALLLLRQQNSVASFRALLPHLILGLAFACILILGINLLHGYIDLHFGRLLPSL